MQQELKQSKRRKRSPELGSLNKKPKYVEYTPEMGNFVCKIIARHPMSLNSLHVMYLDQSFPTPNTITRWRREHPGFAQQFLEAQKLQVETYAETILEIADDDSNDMYLNEKGVHVPNTAALQRAKIRIEARKWMATKLLPNMYGDRIYEEKKVTISHEEALKQLE